MSPDVKPGELIDLIGRALELELPPQLRKRLIDLLQVPQQLIRVDVDARTAPARDVRVSLQLTDLGRRLGAALGAGDVDPLVVEQSLGHDGSPDDGFPDLSGEGESPAGAKRPATRSARGGATWIGEDGPELIAVPRPGHAATSDHGLHTYRTEIVSLDVWQRPGAPYLELRIGERRAQIALTAEAAAHLIARLRDVARVSRDVLAEAAAMSVGGAPGAVDKDDFDARVQQIKGLRDRFEVAIGGPRESLAFGTVFATAGARGTWSYDLPDDPLLAPLALRMLQGCADQIAEVCRLAGGQAQDAGSGGAGPGDLDDGAGDADALDLGDLGLAQEGAGVEGFGHGASPDGVVEGPSGEGESPAGAKRPATRSAGEAG